MVEDRPVPANESTSETMRVTPEIFRRDRYLRASGYNFYVWAIVNLLVIAPLRAACMGNPWPEWLAGVLPFFLIAAGILFSILNDRRVEKMCGEASSVPVVEAGRIWGPMFLVGTALTAVFVVRGPVAYVQPLWLLLVGAAYLQWGAFGLPEFRLLGWALAVAGAMTGLSIRPAEIPPGMAAPSALAVWSLFMGVLWFPFGAYINFRYLHRR